RLRRDSPIPVVAGFVAEVRDRSPLVSGSTAGAEGFGTGIPDEGAAADAGGAGLAAGGGSGGAGVPSTRSDVLPRENGIALRGSRGASGAAARRSASDKMAGRSGGGSGRGAASTSMNGGVRSA